MRSSVLANRKSESTHFDMKNAAFWLSGIQLVKNFLVTKQVLSFHVQSPLHLFANFPAAGYDLVPNRFGYIYNVGAAALEWQEHSATSDKIQQKRMGNSYVSGVVALENTSLKRKEENKTRPSNLQLQLAMTAPHHRHSRRRTEPYFNLRNNLLLTQALALALVGEKIKQG
uniref:Uncharacterized protein n=1 Tax=Oryza brachyantha TaxID=4533 RepID=J3N535_ORYBR